MRKALRILREQGQVILRNPAFFAWSLRHAARLRRFHNANAGQDCFLMGNGPSLARMDLSVLEGRHVFGLNKIHLLFERCPVELSYHAAVNRLVLEQSSGEFGRLSCPSFQSYLGSRSAPVAAPNFYYLATVGGFSFQPNLLGLVSEGNTVTYVALQVAFYLGFERVFLIGVDHSFQARGAPNEKQLLRGEDANHFHPDYFANQEWHLPDLEASELAYRMAHFWYGRAGRRIYDATVGGKLEVFPKISFEDALKECRRKPQRGGDAVA